MVVQETSWLQSGNPNRGSQRWAWSATSNIDMNRGSRNKLMEIQSFRRLRKLHIQYCFVRGSLIAFTPEHLKKEQFTSKICNNKCRLRLRLTKEELPWMLYGEEKLKPLVAEFAIYHTAFCDPQQQPKQLDSVLKSLPKGARVTHRRLISGEVFRGDATLRASNAQSSDGGGLSETVCEGVEAKSWIPSGYFSWGGGWWKLPRWSFKNG